MEQREIAKRFEEISDLLYDLAGEITDENPDYENLPDVVLNTLSRMHDDLMTVSGSLNSFALDFLNFGNWEGKIKIREE